MSNGSTWNHFFGLAIQNKNGISTYIHEDFVSTWVVILPKNEKSSSHLLIYDLKILSEVVQTMLDNLF